MDGAYTTGLGERAPEIGSTGDECAAENKGTCRARLTPRHDPFKGRSMGSLRRWLRARHQGINILKKAPLPRELAAPSCL